VGDFLVSYLFILGINCASLFEVKELLTEDETIVLMFIVVWLTGSNLRHLALCC
jgi:hypothetical protein